MAKLGPNLAEIGTVLADSGPLQPTFAGPGQSWSKTGALWSEPVNVGSSSVDWGHELWLSFTDTGGNLLLGSIRQTLIECGLCSPKMWRSPIGPQAVEPSKSQRPLLWVCAFSCQRTWNHWPKEKAISHWTLLPVHKDAHWRFPLRASMTRKSSRSTSGVSLSLEDEHEKANNAKRLRRDDPAPVQGGEDASFGVGSKSVAGKGSQVQPSCGCVFSLHVHLEPLAQKKRQPYTGLLCLLTKIGRLTDSFALRERWRELLKANNGEFGVGRRSVAGDGRSWLEEAT